MKKSKIMFISVIAVTALLLSACTMGPRAVGTPGLSADGDVVYVAYQQYVYAVDAKTGNEILRTILAPCSFHIPSLFEPFTLNI